MYSASALITLICVFQVNEANLFPNAYQIKNTIVETVRNATRVSPPDELQQLALRLWNQPRLSKNTSTLPSHSEDVRPLFREVIIDIGGANYIDVTRTKASHGLKAKPELHAGQLIRLVFVRMTPNVKTTLKPVGLW